MPSNKDSIQNVIIIALSVCLVSAIIVSGAAVSLKPIREANKALDRNKNILIAAGLYEEGVTSPSDIDSLIEEFDVKVVDLTSGHVLSASEVEAAGIDPTTYDQKKASKDPSLSRALSTEEDIASISRQANYSVIYLLKEGDDVSRVVLPVHGYGLWSTMYGFIALDSDMNTVSGITFYEQEETAGLGGEVENPQWKALWKGKQIYGDDGDVALQVVKGSVDPSSKDAEHKVDGLSGATLTSRGVQNLISFWLGEQGFGPVLKELKS